MFTLQPELSRDYVLSVLDYDAASGRFKWRRKVDTLGRPNNRDVGRPAGKQRPDGYRLIQIKGRGILEHHLVWLVETGRLPINRVDHDNKNPSDNRFSNLREATHAQNLWNRTKQRNNTSGFKGVVRSGTSNRWTARIQANGVYRYLGSFPSREEAAEAYRRAAEELHGDFARV